MQFGWTSVMEASKYGHYEVVEELAKRGANLNLTTVNDYGFMHGSHDVYMTLIIITIERWW